MTRRAPLNRRSAPRWSGKTCGWLSEARLRPGHDIRIVDLSAGGALVDAPIRLLPGSRVELVLAAPGWRWNTAADVVRCEVSDLSGAGARYRAGLRFTRPLQVPLVFGHG